MAKSLAPDRPRATLALVAALVLLVWPTEFTIAAAQVGVIVVAGVIGWRFLPSSTSADPDRRPTRVPISRTTAIVAWVVFFVLLLGLPVLRSATQSQAIALIDSFYRVGSLVFGGGHV